MRAIGVLLAAGVTSAVLGACGGVEASAPGPASAATPAEHELGLFPGETMAFEVKLGGLVVGEAQLAVGEPGLVDGHNAIVVRSRAATAGAAALIKKISDEALSVIDADTGSPLSVQTEVWQGERHTTSTSTFEGTRATVTYVRGEAKPATFVIDFKTNQLHDSHTAMAQVRGWRGKPGDKRSLFVVGGRRMWRVDVSYVGTESVGSELGNRRAIVFDGVSYRARRDLTVESTTPARSFRVWLSDDADRVPLRVTARTELGEIEMILTDYQRP